MLGTPDIRRSRKWDNIKKSYVKGDKVVLSERTFCVEVDYSDIYHLTPDWARYVANELWRIAEEIDGKIERTSKMKAVLQTVSEIAEEAKKEAMS